MCYFTPGTTKIKTALEAVGSIHFPPTNAMVRLCTPAQEVSHMKNSSILRGSYATLLIVFSTIKAIQTM